MNELDKIEDRINEAMGEMKEHTQEPDRKLLRTGFSYKVVNCPNCEEELWIENIGKVTALIHEHTKKQLPLTPETKKETLKEARRNLKDLEKATKSLGNMTKEETSEWLDKVPECYRYKIQGGNDRPSFLKIEKRHSKHQKEIITIKLKYETINSQGQPKERWEVPIPTELYNHLKKLDNMEEVRCTSG